MPLNTAYPKLAALAGFAKDSKVPKGWLTPQTRQSSGVEFRD
jgi:hypothetical protein